MSYSASILLKDGNGVVVGSCHADLLLREYKGHAALFLDGANVSIACTKPCSNGTVEAVVSDVRAILQAPPVTCAVSDNVRLEWGADQPVIECHDLTLGAVDRMLHPAAFSSFRNMALGQIQAGVSRLPSNQPVEVPNKEPVVVHRKRGLLLVGDI